MQAGPQGSEDRLRLILNLFGSHPVTGFKVESLKDSSDPMMSLIVYWSARKCNVSAEYTPLCHARSVVQPPGDLPQTPPSLKPSPLRTALAPPPLRQVHLLPQTPLPFPIGPVSVLVYSHWMWWKGVAWTTAFSCICSKGCSPLSSCRQRKKAQGLDRCRTPIQTRKSKRR